MSMTQAPKIGRNIPEKEKAVLDEMQLLHYNRTGYGNFALERIIYYGKGI